MGKSTVAEEFAKNEYESYILIDFAKASNAVRNAFARYVSDLDSLFMILGAEYGVVLKPGQSLIILRSAAVSLGETGDQASGGGWPLSFPGDGVPHIDT